MWEYMQSFEGQKYLLKKWRVPKTKNITTKKSHHKKNYKCVKHLRWRSIFLTALKVCEQLKNAIVTALITLKTRKYSS